MENTGQGCGALWGLGPSPCWHLGQEFGQERCQRGERETKPQLCNEGSPLCTSSRAMDKEQGLTLGNTKPQEQEQV